MRNTIPRISLRDEAEAVPPPSDAHGDGPDGIPVIELDSSELEDRFSEVPNVAAPNGLDDGITTSARRGAIAGPMGPTAPIERE